MRHSILIAGLLLGIVIPRSLTAHALDSLTLNTFFHSLESRNKAMGSVAISKAGKILYRKAFGYSYLSEEEQIPANAETRYFIWSITKTFTATMILQLVEEGKLTLETHLDRFFPHIPNASKITIRQMLGHRSGIRDFTEDPAPLWDREENKPVTRDLMVQALAAYSPSFEPGEGRRYSNSNFLLLGYMVEQLDSITYSQALNRRISDKIGLNHTTYWQPFPRRNENESFSYRYEDKWVQVDEGNGVWPVPGGAGHIVSTPTDMLKFIHALFGGKLLSPERLDEMTEMDDSDGLGIFKQVVAGHTGLGHTGDYIASHAALMYYPEDSLAIAYCTNGQVYDRERVMEQVLRICYNHGFGISRHRLLIASLTWIIGGIFIGWKMRHRAYNLNEKQGLFSGVLTGLVFWVSLLIGGLLNGAFEHIRNPVFLLDVYYSNSGDFMALAEALISMTSLIFFITLSRIFMRKKLSVLPLIPILLITLCHAGKAVLSPDSGLFFDFSHFYILSLIGPLLSLVLWNKKGFSRLKWLSAISLVLMGLPVLFFIFRPEELGFLNQYPGLLERMIHLGWTSWLWFLYIHIKS